MPIPIAVPLIAAGISATASTIGSLMSQSAAQGMNDRQVKWEREKAKYAHQWEVQDLEKAGLNPVLSAGGQGATAGSISPLIGDYSGISNAGNAFLTATMQSYQIEQMKYQNELLKAQRENTEADTENKGNMNENIKSQTNLNKKQMEYLNTSMKKIESDIERNNWMNKKDKAEIGKICREMTEIDSRVEVEQAQRELIAAQKELTKQEEILKLVQSKQGIEAYKGQILDNKIKAVRAKMRYVDEMIYKTNQALDIGQKFANMANTGTSSIKNLTGSISDLAD